MLIFLKEDIIMPYVVLGHATHEYTQSSQIIMMNGDLV